MSTNFYEKPEIIIDIGFVLCYTFNTCERGSFLCALSYYYLIERFQKICEADLHQTRRRTQTGLTPGKDVNNVWHESDPKDMKRFY